MSKILIAFIEILLVFKSMGNGEHKKNYAYFCHHRKLCIYNYFYAFITKIYYVLLICIKLLKYSSF